MKLATSSNLHYVGRLRYIQAVREPRESRGPDKPVGRFLRLRERLRCRLLSATELEALRMQPFYYYLLARTRYYDDVFQGAIRDKVRHIVNVGTGSDTRAYRFGRALAEAGARVLECDLPESISLKRQLAERLGPATNVRYLAMDLNDHAWPDFEQHLGEFGGTKVMVMMEGVSPYVNDDAFSRFLRLLRGRISPGSSVAYDFKLRGGPDDFGRAGRTQDPFRLPESREGISAFHEGLGFRVSHLEMGWDLEARILPSIVAAGRPLFRQDGLVQLAIE